MNKLWILAEPVQLKGIDYNDMGEPPVVHFGIGEGDVPCISVLECDIPGLLTRLDVESLTTQLEDILQNFWQDEDQDLDDSVAEVLELIGMKGKE